VGIQRIPVLPVAWAIVGVPLTFALFVAVAYRSSVLPFLNGREWLWWAGFVCSLCTGVASIFFVRSAQFAERAIAAAAYVVVMGAALFGVGLAVACLNGDCL